MTLTVPVRCAAHLVSRPPQTCSQLGGTDCCSGTETCPGTTYSGSSDCSGICCSQTCQTSGGGTEVIVDNSDPGFSSNAGSDPRGWWVSSYPNPYGTDSLGTDVNLGSTATWTPNIPQQGTYEVYAWWTMGLYRAYDATYTINHAGGSDQVHVNQSASGGQWNLLGTYTFDAGTSGSVTLSDTTSGPSGPGWAVCADAIRFVLPGQTYHRADTNPQNGCIDTDEILAFISLWHYNSTGYPMSEMMEGVALWRAGTGCT